MDILLQILSTNFENLNAQCGNKVEYGICFLLIASAVHTWEGIFLFIKVLCG